MFSCFGDAIQRDMLKKLSDQKVNHASDQLEQELETYPFGAIRSERYFVDGFEDQRSDLEFEVFCVIFCLFFTFVTDLESEIRDVTFF